MPCALRRVSDGVGGGPAGTVRSDIATDSEAIPGTDITSSGTHRKGRVLHCERHGFVSKAENPLALKHPRHENALTRVATPEASVDFGLTNLAGRGGTMLKEKLQFLGSKWEIHSDGR